MRENDLQKRVIEKFKTCGCLVLNLHGHLMQAPGWPDLYVSSRFWRGWLELKVDGRKLSEVQRLRMKELCRRNDWAYVIRHTSSPDVEGQGGSKDMVQFECVGIHGVIGEPSVIGTMYADEFWKMTGVELLKLIGAYQSGKVMELSSVDRENVVQRGEDVVGGSETSTVV